MTEIEKLQAKVGELEDKIKDLEIEEDRLNDEVDDLKNEVGGRNEELNEYENQAAVPEFTLMVDQEKYDLFIDSISFFSLEQFEAFLKTTKYQKL